MPLYTIEDSKFTSETISIVQDFSDMLVGGETIVGTPTIAITLLTGTDSNPNNLLYMGITTQGSLVEQRFRLGIPGCIYSIVYTIVTTFPHTYEKETFLAVLPMAGNVSPEFTSILETSCLYPYEQVEEITGSQILIGGTFWRTFYFDGISSVQILLSGTATYQNYITYSTRDFLQSVQILLTGTLTYQNYISYSRDYDSLKGTQILISGTLVAGTIITYSNDFDSLKGSQLLQSGTLS